MKFLTKDSNFKQIVMSNEFEKLDKILMVEIIRRHQSPLSSTNLPNPLNHDKCIIFSFFFFFFLKRLFFTF